MTFFIKICRNTHDRRLSLNVDNYPATCHLP